MRSVFPVKMGRVILAVLVMTLSCSVRTALSIGLLGHLVVAEMRVEKIGEVTFPDLVLLLNSFPDERCSGADFPDWACASLHSEYSSVAHSVEFQQAWADYLKTNFSPPYSCREIRELSFLLGITAHTYGDPPWHAFFLPAVKKHDGAGERLVEAGVEIFANWKLGKRDEVTTGYLPADTASRYLPGWGTRR